jgi:hypothetical protein
MKTLSEMKSGLHRHQHRELFERTLDDDEIESLIDKARESALAIKNDKKRDKEEREQAKGVLDFIDDVEDIWDKVQDPFCLFSFFLVSFLIILYCKC